MRGFDTKQQGLFEMLVGSELTGDQMVQVGLPVKMGGFGLRSAVLGADAAYVASRGLTLEACVAVDAGFTGEGDAFHEVQCGLGLGNSTGRQFVAA